MKMAIAWICLIAVFVGAYFIALKLYPPPEVDYSSNLVVNSAALNFG